MVAVTVTDSGNSSGSSNCGDNENSTRGGSDDDHQKAPVLLPIQLQQLHTCSDRRNTTSTKHKERNSFQGS